MTKKLLFFIGTLGLICTSSVFAAVPHSMTTKTHAHHRGRASKRTKQALNGLVNINKSGIKTVATLKGIGLKRAKAIVDYREKHGAFKAIEDLALVKGLSKQSVAKILKKNPGRVILNSVG